MGHEFYAPAGPLRILRRNADDGVLDSHGRCATCGANVPAAETTMEPGPGFGQGVRRDDPVSHAIARPRRLLEPVRV